MGTIEDLKGKLAAASALVDKLKAGDDVDATIKAIEAEDAARAELQAARGRAGKLAAKLAEREARAVAGGAYLVEGVDLGAMLHGADPEKLPGGGVVVVRSHTAASKKVWDAEVGVSGGRPMADIMADLVVANTVRIGDRPFLPDAPGADALQVGYRNFFESDLGSGIANLLGTKVLALGGARADETKRQVK